MDVLAVRDALADVIAAGCPTLFVSKGVKDQVQTPAVIVPLPEMEYLQTGDRTAKATFVVQLLMVRATEDVAQERLAAAMSSGPGSVVDAVEESNTLGGACDSATVLRAGRIGTYTHDNILYIGMEFTIDVIA